MEAGVFDLLGRIKVVSSHYTEVRKVRSVFQAMICNCKLMPIPAILRISSRDVARGVHSSGSG